MSFVYPPLLGYLPLLVGFLGSSAFALPASPASKYNETASEYHTALGKVRFNAEPVGRGTVGIIFSCTATYIFCVWTAVHPNINVKTTWGTRLWYKCVLMVLSVIVPEGLLVCAFGQFYEARMLKKAWAAKMKSEGKPKDVVKKLGMNEAFFVVMGGFLTDIIEYKPINREAEELSSGTYTSILTPTGFLHYLESGHMNEESFDVAEIKDKGKANTIAKLLACGQASWLIVQSFARWRAQLPVTLLEIHVLIQVFCTTFIYILWWSKPLDVDEPVRITLRRLDDHIDPDSTSSTRGGSINAGHPSSITQPPATTCSNVARNLGHVVIRTMEGEIMIREGGNANDPATCTLCSPCGARVTGILHDSLDTTNHNLSPPVLTENSLHVIPRPCVLACSIDGGLSLAPPGQDANRHLVDENSTRPSSAQPLIEADLDPAPPSLGDPAPLGLGDPAPPDLRDPNVLHDQVEKSKTYSRLNHLVTKTPCRGNIAIKGKAFFDLVTYIYSEGIAATSEEVTKEMALYGVLGMVIEGSLVVLVGGLHLLAWNVHFPTGIESVLWKVCSFGMTLFPSIVVFVASFTRYERDLFPILWEVHFGGLRHPDLLGYGIGHIHKICIKHALARLSPSRSEDPNLSWSLLAELRYGRLLGLLHYVLVSLCLLSLLCYALCTTFIVVESYISMRDPPPGSFTTPRWTDYWRHL